jgi:dTDP-4-amino-4,6-dideoxygalactose transaminase
LGGEVICPSFTFAATAHAIVWNGLVPVFVDSLPGTCTIDPRQIERALSSRTVAICPVYVYGLPPDMEQIRAIARRAGVPVVSDSAQGLGATYQGFPAGTWADLEVFSLSPTKVVTAIEGGLVTTDHADLAEKARSLRDYGKALDGPMALEDMAEIGLSARMSELHGTVGLLNLRAREQLVSARLRLIALYRERLGKLPGCSVQTHPQNRTTSGNYFVLFISDSANHSRDQVHDALKDRGIQTKRYFYPPVHAQTAQKKYPMRVVGDLPNTRKASREALALPLYCHMTQEQLDEVCRAVEQQLAQK